MRGVSTHNENLLYFNWCISALVSEVVIHLSMNSLIGSYGEDDIPEFRTFWQIVVVASHISSWQFLPFLKLPVIQLLKQY